MKDKRCNKCVKYSHVSQQADGPDHHVCKVICCRHNDNDNRANDDETKRSVDLRAGSANVRLMFCCEQSGNETPNNAGGAGDPGPESHVCKVFCCEQSGRTSNQSGPSLEQRHVSG
jgi:hypothetical protein